METDNLLEKLVAISPGMEIWWDSSPLIFENWSRKMLAKATAADKPILAAQIKRMYDPDGSGAQLFRGVTTNPPLSLQVIREDETYWRGVVGEMYAKNPGIDKESLFWLLYKEIVRLGSEMYLPLFERSGQREGYISGQVDPRYSFDRKRMLEQAFELAAINPNVMVKIPGTKEGFEVIEILTSQGITTNNTLSFTLPQLMDCARTVARGLEVARKNQVDLSRWRSVITQMEARYSDLGGLRDQAKQIGIELTEADLRLAEAAIFKKAYRLITSHGYPSKLLSCSLRLGPTVDGKLRLWHLEEKAGGSVVITCPPSFIDDVIYFPDQQNIRFSANRIDQEIPAVVLEKLLKVPYFERAYREDGYSREEYNLHPALVKTDQQFHKATDEMVEFVANCMA